MTLTLGEMEKLPGVNNACQLGNDSSVFSKCCEKKLWPMQIAADWSSISAGISFSVVACIGFVLNAFALVALYQSETTRNKPGTSFVMNLALIDLIICLVVLPVDAATAFTKNDWSSADASTITQNNIPKAVCYFAGLAKYATIVMHGTSLAMIGIERYFKIVVGSQVHERVFCTLYKRLMIALDWILTWTIFVVFGDFGFSGAVGGNCSLAWHYMHLRPLVIGWVLFTMIVILISCSKIYLHVRKSTAAVAMFSRMSFLQKQENHTPSNSSAFTSPTMIPPGDSTSTPGVDGQGSVPDTAVDSVPDTSLPKHSVHLEVPIPYSRRASVSSSGSAVEDTPVSSPPGRRVVKAAPAKRELYLVKMIAITAGTYVCCATPLAVLNTLDNCGQKPNFRNILWAWSLWLPVFNFFIYVRANPVYRRSCLKLIEKIRNRLPCHGLHC